MSKKGLLLVISGPAGAGKGTICDGYLHRHPDTFLSISATTRGPREGEINGKNYYFLTKESFEEMIEGNELLEWAEFVGNYYGTPKNVILEKLEQGHDVILEIDVQGALAVQKQFSDGVFIFVVPPSFGVLRQRLVQRGTEPPDIVNKRLEKAKWELENSNAYDYLIINDLAEHAVEQLETIVKAEKQKIRRNRQFIKEEFVV